jgi:hypothetical protein
MPALLATLKRDAAARALKRGHALQRFTNHSPGRARAACRHCGAAAEVVAAPRSAEPARSGAALVTWCAARPAADAHADALDASWPRPDAARDILQQHLGRRFTAAQARLFVADLNTQARQPVLDPDGILVAMLEAAYGLALPELARQALAHWLPGSAPKPLLPNPLPSPTAPATPCGPAPVPPEAVAALKAFFGSTPGPGEARTEILALARRCEGTPNAREQALAAQLQQATGLPLAALAAQLKGET